jgi:NDP-sugar pyrophosphorylase family protein
MSGLGTRFQSKGYTEPKPLIKVLDDTMVRTVIRNLDFPGAFFTFVINQTQISVEDFVSHISDLIEDFEVVSVEKVTDGPASSCLLTHETIDSDLPLIIANCDQVVHDFNYFKLYEFCERNKADGALGCFISSSPKNSYVSVDETGVIIEVKEKVVISNLATNGLHFWMKASDFVSSAKTMVSCQDTCKGEYYVAPTFNYLIKDGKKILPFFYNLHFPIGTPEDLVTYRKVYSYGKTQN